MKGSMIGMVAGGCLVVGFGVGFALRPVIAPAGASAAAVAGVAQPTEEEAIAAVRRHRLFSGTSLANATLKLGDCSPGGVGPGVTCMTQLTMDATQATDRESVGVGKRVSVRVDLGGRRCLKKTTICKQDKEKTL